MAKRKPGNGTDHSGEAVLSQVDPVKTKTVPSTLPASAEAAPASRSFGNRCSRDGSFYDEGGICPHGHQKS